MKKLFTLLAAFLFAFAVDAQHGFQLKEDKLLKKVEVWYNDRMLTAYCYFDTLEKPILYPVKTLDGSTITRGYPIASRAGEWTDHPHQVGVWFTHERVNGIDFWNNSFAIPESRKEHYGTIRHRKILSMKSSADRAVLRTLSEWVDYKETVLLQEETVFTFSVAGNAFIIERVATLVPRVPEVTFEDIKDALLGIRVARELEMPSAQKRSDRFIGEQGKVTTLEEMQKAEVTGLYRNEEGLTGDDVWGKRSRWVCLNGKINNQPVSIAIVDHPRNPGYPSFWHARGYGLFAANPLGKKIFTEGREVFNFRLREGEKTVFRYRMVIAEKEWLTPEWLSDYATNYATN